MSIRSDIDFLRKKNGREVIIGKLGEECSELTAALLKIQNDGITADRMTHLIEELADVYIMQQQMVLDLNPEESVDYIRTIEQKIERQKERIRRNGEN